MHQSLGYEVEGAKEVVCHLLRSIYGLKRSPRSTWYTEIDRYLCGASSIRNDADHNLYILRQGCSILLLLYVDDLLITGNDDMLIQHVKAQLQHQYKMQDLGPVQRYLGVEFFTSSHGIFMHQRQYAIKSLANAGMQDCEQPWYHYRPTHHSPTTLALLTSIKLLTVI